MSTLQERVNLTRAVLVGIVVLVGILGYDIYLRGQEKLQSSSSGGSQCTQCPPGPAGPPGPQGPQGPQGAPGLSTPGPSSAPASPDTQPSYDIQGLGLVVVGIALFPTQQQNLGIGLVAVGLLTILTHSAVFVYLFLGFAVMYWYVFGKKK